MRTMNGRFLVLWALGLFLLAGSDARGQVDMRRTQLEMGPTFYAEAIAYASAQPQKARVDVYVQVPHEEIRFLKEGDQYIGRYEINLSVATPAKQPVLEQTWMVDVPVSDFSQTTQTKLYSLTHRTLEIDPGNYQFTIHVRDQESRKASQIKKSILVMNFSKDTLSLSDIMLVNRLSTDGERRTIVPNITGSVNYVSQGFFIFLETYNTVPLDSVDLTWKIYNAKKDEVFSRSQKEAVTGHKTQVFLKVDSTLLHMGTYYLAVEASAQGSSGNAIPFSKATTSRTFNVRSTDLPVAIVDLDKAIDQLLYIAKSSELDYIREATTEEDKRTRFLEFWSKRDPDPQTKRNELMEEYYARVQYANQNFTRYVDGWRSDMGMIFIRFGTPDNIERHPFENYAKPYEVWYYYQLNLQFIFVDENGFGDYRLSYPTTDLWGRVR